MKEGITRENREDTFLKERAQLIRAFTEKLRERFPDIHIAFDFFRARSRILKLPEIRGVCFYDSTDARAVHENLQRDAHSRERPELDMSNDIRSHLDTVAKRTNIAIQPIALEGEDSILGKLEQVERHWNRSRSVGSEAEDPLAASLLQDIGRSFCDDVDGGLRRYQQDFILKLSQMKDPVRAEKLWGMVRTAVREREFTHARPKGQRQRELPATLQ